MADKLAMVVFSGTVDRLMPVGIIASGAVAMGLDVEVFLTFWGLNSFRKESLTSKTKNVPSWFDTLKKAKEIGNVRIHACAMTYDLMNMKKEDLADIVDDVMAVGEFVDIAKDAKFTLFI